MSPTIQNGYLVLADISGYTFFLANTELEHANIVIKNLLEAMLEKMGDMLTISKLEGDAIFAYSESNMPDDNAILDLIDQTYLAFREKMEDMSSNAVCPCRACQTIGTLDLKFMVHRGDFVIQQVGGIKDAWGSDVNLLHRLLKNSVVESTGWKSYALFTSQGMQNLQVDMKLFTGQSESYDYLGKVETYVMDMHHRYHALKAV